MPLAQCDAYRGDNAAVLIGTEDLVQALDHGFHGFVTGACGSRAATSTSLSSTLCSLQFAKRKHPDSQHALLRWPGPYLTFLLVTNV